MFSLHHESDIDRLSRYFRGGNIQFGIRSSRVGSYLDVDRI